MCPNPSTARANAAHVYLELRLATGAVMGRGNFRFIRLRTSSVMLSSGEKRSSVLAGDPKAEVEE